MSMLSWYFFTLNILLLLQQQTTHNNTQHCHQRWQCNEQQEELVNVLPDRRRMVWWWTVGMMWWLLPSTSNAALAEWDSNTQYTFIILLNYGDTNNHCHHCFFGLKDVYINWRLINRTQRQRSEAVVTTERNEVEWGCFCCFCCFCYCYS